MKRYLLSLVAVVLCLTLLCGCGNSDRFTPTKWVDNPYERTAIVDDLLETYELIGMTEDEILTLLGPHDNYAGYFVEPDRFVYCLGPERGWISIDNEWLLIDFQGDRVIDYSITRD